MESKKGKDKDPKQVTKDISRTKRRSPKVRDSRTDLHSGPSTDYVLEPPKLTVRASPKTRMKRAHKEAPKDATIDADGNSSRDARKNKSMEAHEATNATDAPKKNTTTDARKHTSTSYAHENAVSNTRQGASFGPQMGIFQRPGRVASAGQVQRKSLIQTVLDTAMGSITSVLARGNSMNSSLCSSFSDVASKVGEEADDEHEENLSMSRKVAKHKVLKHHVSPRMDDCDSSEEKIDKSKGTVFAGKLRYSRTPRPISPHSGSSMDMQTQDPTSLSTVLLSSFNMADFDTETSTPELPAQQQAQDVDKGGVQLETSLGTVTTMDSSTDAHASSKTKQKHFDRTANAKQEFSDGETNNETSFCNYSGTAKQKLSNEGKYTKEDQHGHKAAHTQENIQNQQFYNGTVSDCLQTNVNKSCSSGEYSKLTKEHVCRVDTAHNNGLAGSENIDKSRRESTKTLGDTKTEKTHTSSNSSGMVETAEGYYDEICTEGHISIKTTKACPLATSAGQRDQNTTCAIPSFCHLEFDELSTMNGTLEGGCPDAGTSLPRHDEKGRRNTKDIKSQGLARSQQTDLQATFEKIGKNAYPWPCTIPGIRDLEGVDISPICIKMRTKVNPYPEATDMKRKGLHSDPHSLKNYISDDPDMTSEEISLTSLINERDPMLYSSPGNANYRLSSVSLTPNNSRSSERETTDGQSPLPLLTKRDDPLAYSYEECASIGDSLDNKVIFNGTENQPESELPKWSTEYEEVGLKIRRVRFSDESVDKYGFANLVLPQTISQDAGEAGPTMNRRRAKKSIIKNKHARNHPPNPAVYSIRAGAVDNNGHQLFPTLNNNDNPQQNQQFPEGPGPPNRGSVPNCQYKDGSNWKVDQKSLDNMHNRLLGDLYHRRLAGMHGSLSTLNESLARQNISYLHNMHMGRRGVRMLGRKIRLTPGDMASRVVCSDRQSVPPDFMPECPPVIREADLGEGPQLPKTEGNDDISQADDQCKGTKDNVTINNDSKIEKLPPLPKQVKLYRLGQISRSLSAYGENRTIAEKQNLGITSNTIRINATVPSAKKQKRQNKNKTVGQQPPSKAESSVKSCSQIEETSAKIPAKTTAASSQMRGQSGSRCVITCHITGKGSIKALTKHKVAIDLSQVLDWKFTSDAEVCKQRPSDEGQNKSPGPLPKEPSDGRKVDSYQNKTEPHSKSCEMTEQQLDVPSISETQQTNSAELNESNKSSIKDMQEHIRCNDLTQSPENMSGDAGHSYQSVDGINLRSKKARPRKRKTRDQSVCLLCAAEMRELLATAEDPQSKKEDAVKQRNSSQQNICLCNRLDQTENCSLDRNIPSSEANAKQSNHLPQTSTRAPHPADRVSFTDEGKKDEVGVCRRCGGDGQISKTLSPREVREYERACQTRLTKRRIAILQAHLAQSVTSDNKGHEGPALHSRMQNEQCTHTSLPPVMINASSLGSLQEQSDHLIEITLQVAANKQSFEAIQKTMKEGIRAMKSSSAIGRSARKTEPRNMMPVTDNDAANSPESTSTTHAQPVRSTDTIDQNSTSDTVINEDVEWEKNVLAGGVVWYRPFNKDTHHSKIETASVDLETEESALLDPTDADNPEIPLQPRDDQQSTMIDEPENTTSEARGKQHAFGVGETITDNQHPTDVVDAEHRTTATGDQQLRGEGTSDLTSTESIRQEESTDSDQDNQPSDAEDGSVLRFIFSTQVINKRSARESSDGIFVSEGSVTPEERETAVLSKTQHKSKKTKTSSEDSFRSSDDTQSEDELTLQTIMNTLESIQRGLSDEPVQFVNNPRQQTETENWPKYHHQEAAMEAGDVVEEAHNGSRPRDFYRLKYAFHHRQFAGGIFQFVDSIEEEEEEEEENVIGEETFTEHKARMDIPTSKNTKGKNKKDEHQHERNEKDRTNNNKETKLPKKVLPRKTNPKQNETKATKIISGDKSKRNSDLKQHPQIKKHKAISGAKSEGKTLDHAPRTHKLKVKPIKPKRRPSPQNQQAEQPEQTSRSCSIKLKKTEQTARIHSLRQKTEQLALCHKLNAPKLEDPRHLHNLKTAKAQNPSQIRRQKAAKPEHLPQVVKLPTEKNAPVSAAPMGVELKEQDSRKQIHSQNAAKLERPPDTASPKAMKLLSKNAPRVSEATVKEEEAKDYKRDEHLHSQKDEKPPQPRGTLRPEAVTLPTKHRPILEALVVEDANERIHGQQKVKAKHPPDTHSSQVVSLPAKHTPTSEAPMYDGEVKKNHNTVREYSDLSRFPPQMTKVWKHTIKTVRNFASHDPRQVSSTSNIHGKVSAHKAFLQKIPADLLQAKGKAHQNQGVSNTKTSETFLERRKEYISPKLRIGLLTSVLPQRDHAESEKVVAGDGHDKKDVSTKEETASHQELRLAPSQRNAPGNTKLNSFKTRNQRSREQAGDHSPHATPNLQSSIWKWLKHEKSPVDKDFSFVGNTELSDGCSEKANDNNNEEEKKEEEPEVKREIDDITTNPDCSLPAILTDTPGATIISSTASTDNGTSSNLDISTDTKSDNSITTSSLTTVYSWASYDTDGFIKELEDIVRSQNVSNNCGDEQLHVQVDSDVSRVDTFDFTQGTMTEELWETGGSESEENEGTSRPGKTEESRGDQ